MERRKLREGKGNAPKSLTLLTCEPGPDVAPYDNRQIVVLRPEKWNGWIKFVAAEAELLKSLPAGALSVVSVRSGHV